MALFRSTRHPMPDGRRQCRSARRRSHPARAAAAGVHPRPSSVGECPARRPGGRCRRQQAGQQTNPTTTKAARMPSLYRAMGRPLKAWGSSAIQRTFSFKKRFLPSLITYSPASNGASASSQRSPSTESAPSLIRRLASPRLLTSPAASRKAGGVLASPLSHASSAHRQARPRQRRPR